MAQRPNNTVCFVNNDRYGDSLAYDMSADCDTNSLLPEDGGRISYKSVYRVFFDLVLRDHLKVFIVVCDTICVIVLTLFFTTMNSLTCETHDDLEEWCQPFEPVDKVVVDLNLKQLVHCDSPRSCVAYAEILMTKQGYNYNFMVGVEGLVYVGQGYECRTDVLRLQMLAARYILYSSYSTSEINPEVLIRYQEIIHEGLSCGKILPNFTVSVKCGVYGDFCGNNYIRSLPWEDTSRLRTTWQRPYAWREPPHRPGHPFLAFDTSRVYKGQYRLSVCNHTQQQATDKQTGPVDYD